MNRAYHIPVMLDQCLEGLSINPNGIYVDVTFGGGGHSIEILKRLENGRLLAFDQDPDALLNKIDDERFTLIPHNFKHIKNYLRTEGVKKVDGILADLGVSSHQFDEGSRGFSIRFDAELDMRMDQKKDLTAKKIVAEYTFEELAKMIRMYGEIPNAGKYADGIIKARKIQDINTTFELTQVIENLAPKGTERKIATQIFQAIRIEVNEELEALKSLLTTSEQLLDTGGRLVIMSYHSLEDRLVKNWMRAGDLEGVQNKDFFGNLIRPFNPIKSKAIKATEKEIVLNTRAKSARLRIAERT